MVLGHGDAHAALAAALGLEDAGRGHDAWTEVLHGDVCLGDKLHEEGLGVRIAEVEGDGFLAGVGDAEVDWMNRRRRADPGCGYRRSWTGHSVWMMRAASASMRVRLSPGLFSPLLPRNAAGVWAANMEKRALVQDFVDKRPLRTGGILVHFLHGAAGVTGTGPRTRPLSLTWSSASEPRSLPCPRGRRPGSGGRCGRTRRPSSRRGWR